jgi:myo-inositol-1(or 4)-monophosphatase
MTKLQAIEVSCKTIETDFLRPKKMNDASKFNELTTIAIEAAMKAGVLLRKGFGTNYKIELKPGIQNYVTEYDHASEKLILDIIQQRFPSHSFLCEECGSIPNEHSEILWIVDPLDGTTNFTHHIPLFCISIGAYNYQELVSGVIYQPMTDELFVAEKGKGAYLNGKRLKVSTTPFFKGGIGATGFPRNIIENPLNCINHFIQILKMGTIIRNIGSSAINLAYVAAGRFDAYWAISLHSWDIAAGKLLIEEAGGKMTTYEGDEYHVLSNKPIVSTNGLIHEELLGYLKLER